MNARFYFIFIMLTNNFNSDTQDVNIFGNLFIEQATTGIGRASLINGLSIYDGGLYVDGDVGTIQFKNLASSGNAIYLITDSNGVLSLSEAGGGGTVPDPLAINYIKGLILGTGLNLNSDYNSSSNFLGISNLGNTNNNTNINGLNTNIEGDINLNLIGNNVNINTTNNGYTAIGNNNNSVISLVGDNILLSNFINISTGSNYLIVDSDGYINTSDVSISVPDPLIIQYIKGLNNTNGLSLNSDFYSSTQFLGVTNLGNATYDTNINGLGVYINRNVSGDIHIGNNNGGVDSYNGNIYIGNGDFGNIINLDANNSTGLITIGNTSKSIQIGGGGESQIININSEELNLNNNVIGNISIASGSNTGIITIGNMNTSENTINGNILNLNTSTGNIYIGNSDIDTQISLNGDNILLSNFTEISQGNNYLAVDNNGYIITQAGGGGGIPDPLYIGSILGISQSNGLLLNADQLGGPTIMGNSFFNTMLYGSGIYIDCNNLIAITALRSLSLFSPIISLSCNGTMNLGTDDSTITNIYGNVINLKGSNFQGKDSNNNYLGVDSNGKIITQPGGGGSIPDPLTINSIITSNVSNNGNINIQSTESVLNLNTQYSGGSVNIGSLISNYPCNVNIYGRSVGISTFNDNTEGSNAVRISSNNINIGSSTSGVSNNNIIIGNIQDGNYTNQITIGTRSLDLVTINALIKLNGLIYDENKYYLAIDSNKNIITASVAGDASIPPTFITSYINSIDSSGLNLNYVTSESSLIYGTTNLGNTTTGETNIKGSSINISSANTNTINIGNDTNTNGNIKIGSNNKNTYIHSGESSNINFNETKNLFLGVSPSTSLSLNGSSNLILTSSGTIPTLIDSGSDNNIIISTGYTPVIPVNSNNKLFIESPNININTSNTNPSSIIIGKALSQNTFNVINNISTFNSTTFNVIATNSNITANSIALNAGDVSTFGDGIFIGTTGEDIYFKGLSQGNLSLDANKKLINTSSSIKYKKDINNINISNEDFKKLKFIEFFYNDFSKIILGKQIGLIAEEVNKIDSLKFLVIKDENNEVDSIDYNSIYRIAISKLIELMDRFNELENDIKFIKNENKKIKGILNKIKILNKEFYNSIISKKLEEELGLNLGLNY